MTIYFYRIIKNGKTVDKCSSHSKRRFINNLRTIKNLSNEKKIYLKVNYGRMLDNYGNYSIFINDGYYENIKDLWRAFNTFTE